MKNRIYTLLLTCATLASCTVFAAAAEPPLIVYGNSHFYQIKPDFSGFTEISKEVYYKTALQDRPPIEGIDSVKVAFEQKDRDIFVDSVKVLTLPDDPGGIMDMRYEVYNLYKVQTPDQRTFYYIQSGLNVAMPNSYGETDDLVEVKDGKVLQSLKVYAYLQFINSNLWRSTECISGAGYYGLHQLSLGAKPVDVNLSELVVKAAIRNKDTFEGDLSTVRHLGDVRTNAIFMVQCADAKGHVLPRVKFYNVALDGTVTVRNEIAKKFTFYDMGLYVHNGDILSLEQDQRVLRNLTDKKTIYFEGSAKNLGTFSKTKQTAFKAKLPVYQYRNKNYICLEDLSLLGYAMKWDSKARIGHWTYIGKKSGKIHVFKSKTVYDNDVFASINGQYYSIYNAEGYSLINLDELYDLKEAK